MNTTTSFVPVGVDIGSKTHVVCIGTDPKAKPFSINNTPAGWQSLVQRLKRLPDVRLTMEATGIYYLDLALSLAEAGISLQVVNPKVAHHFAKAMSQRSSTDPMDACMLAHFSQRMTFRSWEPPRQTLLGLRAIARQIAQLTDQRTADKNRLHALQAHRQTPRLLIQDLKNGIRALDRRLVKLTDHAEQLILQDAELHLRFKAFIAGKGIAKTSAIAILGELALLPQSLKAKQCVSHAGLDVILKTSGTSVAKKPKLSKQGNRYLRAALYMPVLVAVQHDPIAKAFYEKLQSHGKTKLQALCAVMRKYLTALWAIVKHPEPFDTQRLFDMTQLKITERG